MRGKGFEKPHFEGGKGFEKVLRKGPYVSKTDRSGILELSEKTVGFHKHHIQQSFNLRSNADVVLFALKQGLITFKA
jgi:Bacterial regulatory proteins, luxR family